MLLVDLPDLFFHPTPLMVEGYIKFVRMRAEPRRTWNKPIFYHIDRFRITFYSDCLSVLFPRMQSTGRNFRHILLKLGTGVSAIDNGSERTTFYIAFYFKKLLYKQLDGDTRYLMIRRDPRYRFYLFPLNFMGNSVVIEKNTECKCHVTYPTSQFFLNDLLVIARNLADRCKRIIRLRITSLIWLTYLWSPYPPYPLLWNSVTVTKSQNRSLKTETRNIVTIDHNNYAALIGKQ